MGILMNFKNLHKHFKNWSVILNVYNQVLTHQKQWIKNILVTKLNKEYKFSEHDM